MKSLAIVFLMVSWTAAANAANPIDVETYLREFHANPVKVMNGELMRWDQDGRIVPSQPLFDSEDIESGKYLEMRDRVRSDICDRAGESCAPTPPRKRRYFAEVLGTDRVEDFLYQLQVIRRLDEMEQRGLTKVILPDAPWNESYWPIRSGILARRYLDPGFSNDQNTPWNVNFDYFNSVPPTALPPSKLSPAEKYDYLIGDSQWTLTKAMWKHGERLMKEYKTVPLWMGICHGWAPASYMYKLPEHPVTVQARGGGAVTFYPSDIKGLLSLTYATSGFKMKFLGKRCYTHRPPEDEIGRVVDPDCFTTNPGTWHLAVVNQLGIARRSLVFDATYDHQVWNFPVYAYSYTYFNPQTLAKSKTLFGAKVAMRDYKIDKFKKYRSPRATSAVGIAMDVTYPLETQPSAGRTGDSRKTVRYVYDLELDDRGKIIGGEWYSNHHPDFIWSPAPDARPVSSGEYQLDLENLRWDGIGPIPDALVEAARISSPKEEAVTSIVEGLYELSRRQSAPAAAPGAPLSAPASPQP